MDGTNGHVPNFGCQREAPLIMLVLLMRRRRTTLLFGNTKEDIVTNLEVKSPPALVIRCFESMQRTCSRLESP